MKKIDYDLYLFDIDGTLIDTAELIFQCYLVTCREFGKYEITKEQVTEYMGIPLEKQMRIFLPSISQEQLDLALTYFRAYQKTIYQGYISLFPQVKETLMALKEKGKALGVVTSRTRETLVPYLNILEIAPYFDFTVSPEDTSEHKPHPDPVFKAMEKAGLSQGEKILFVGDAEFDIQSGNRAGTHTALVLWGHNGPDDIESTPTHTLGRMEDLL